MASRGWQGVTLSDVAKLGKQQEVKKRSKYRNVKTTIDGQVFDSKREADVWIGLRAREQAKEIINLQRQLSFPLSCPDLRPGITQPIENGAPSRKVCEYIADFVYRERESLRVHVVDVKGVKTAIYKLKKKWMALEHGIEIEEV